MWLVETSTDGREWRTGPDRLFNFYSFADTLFNFFLETGAEGAAFVRLIDARTGLVHERARVIL